MEFDNLIQDIIRKKELSGLSYDFVYGLLESYLKNEAPKLWAERAWLANERSKNYKGTIKAIRKILREVYGAFKEEGFGKRELLLNNIKDIKDIEGHAELLKLHRSTKERLPYYFEVYGKIVVSVDKIESILDLGAGMNPLSIPFMHYRPPMYYAVEVAEKDVEFINRYFKKVKVKGHAFAKDLTKLDNLPGVDMCFMFKLMDTLESLKKGVTKEIVPKINARWLVVSFATKALGGKKSISTKRLSWFRKIIKSYSYTTFEIPNEIFFVIRLK